MIRPGIPFFMHEKDREKLIKAGIQVFQKDETLMVIREATPGYRWQVRYRPRSLAVLRKIFKKLMKDPRAVRG